MMNEENQHPYENKSEGTGLPETSEVNISSSEETDFDRGYSQGQRDCKEYFEERISVVEDKIEKLTAINNGKYLYKSEVMDLINKLKE